MAMRTMTAQVPVDALPERVIRAATDAGLGGWKGTERANPDNDSSSSLFFLGIGIPVLAAQVALPVGYFGWQILSEEDNPGLGWAMFVFSAVLAIGAIIAAIALCSHGMRVRRRGKLMIHLYEFGFVLDRTRGPVVASTYASATAELIVFENSTDDTDATWDEHAVKITLPNGPVTIAHRPQDSAFARSLATACGAPSVQRMTAAEFAVLESEWSPEGHDPRRIAV